MPTVRTHQAWLVVLVVQEAAVLTIKALVVVRALVVLEMQLFKVMLVQHQLLVLRSRVAVAVVQEALVAQ